MVLSDGLVRRRVEHLTGGVHRKRQRDLPESAELIDVHLAAIALKNVVPLALYG